MLRFLINVQFLFTCSLSTLTGPCRCLQLAPPTSALISCSPIQCKYKQVSPGLNPSQPQQAFRLNFRFLAGQAQPPGYLSCHSPHGTPHPSNSMLHKRSPCTTQAHAARPGTSYFFHSECHSSFYLIHTFSFVL